MKTRQDVLERIVRHIAAIEIERMKTARRSEPNLNRIREYFAHEELMTSHLDELDAVCYFEAQETLMRKAEKIGGTD